MPIYSPTGFLDITNATLRTSNTECQNLKIGTGNLYVTSEISPDYILNLSNVTNLGATSPHTLTLSNVTTAIDATSNIITSGNLKIGGLIYTKDWGIRSASGSNDLYVGRFTALGITEVLITDQGASLGSASKYTITRNVDSTPLVNGIDSSSTIDYQWYFTSHDSTTYDLWVRPSAAVQTNVKVTSSTYIEVDEPTGVTLIPCVNGLINMSGNVVANQNLTVSSNLTVSGNATVSTDLTVSGNTFYTSPVSINVDSNVVTEYTGPHDRPLRKYPEVALTADAETGSGYKGYKVTTNGNYSSRFGWEAFDSIPLGSAWATEDGTYLHTGNGDDADTAGQTAATFTAGGVDYTGHWIKLELPKAIKLQRAFINAYNSETVGSDDRRPKKGVFLGSNNDSTWDLVHAFDGDLGWSYTSNNQDGATINFSNVSTKYKYILLLVEEKQLPSSSSATRIEIFNIEYYGYEEGSGSLDTTLKTVYNVPATTGTQLEVYYDAKDLAEMPTDTVTDLAGGDQNGTVTGHSPTLDSTDGINSFVFDGVDDYITSTLTGLSSSQYTMAGWIKVNTLDSTVNTFFGLGDWASGNGRAIGVAINSNNVIGANVKGLPDATFSEVVTGEWYHVVADFTSDNDTHLYVNGKLVDTVAGTTFAIPTNPPLFVGSRANASGTVETARLFPGSIANFRLYSKALNADQVKELYDYQKDYFLGSKSQLTLYKGHLGVGVTEPSGQLELAGDERLQEYPPRGMTDFDTYIEGHGVFTASATTYGATSATKILYHPWKAFNKDRTDDGNGDNSWLNGPDISGGDYNSTTGVYEGTEKHHEGAPIGAALQLSMPYEIYLKGYSLAPWNYATGTNFQYADSPSDFIIYGSKDNVNWKQIDSRTGQGMISQADIKRFSLDTQDSYSHFAIVVTKNNTAAYPSTPASFVAIEEWRLFGTPGPTTLDKGSLTLGRSLDVPRVSRYDVDTETPRPEKLLVDFDTTVNSSPTDISGKGNHGKYVNGADYSPADKAFVFDGSAGCKVEGRSGFVGGTVAHSMSCWFKVGSGISGTTDAGTLLSLGSYSSNPPGSQISALYVYDDRLGCYHWNNDILTEVGSFDVDDKSWHMMTYVHLGGAATVANQRIYLDGVSLPLTTTGATHTGGNLVIAADASFSVGATAQTNANMFTGLISNPKLYNVALEPSEVQKLYRLGRTGRSMVISDTAVGIGKAPEAQLDVRGIIRGSSPAVFSAKANATMTATAAKAVAVFGNVITDTAGGWDSSNNRYYAKVPGFYWVFASEFVIPVTNVYSVIGIELNGTEIVGATGFSGPGGYPRAQTGILTYMDVDDYIQCKFGSDSNRTTESGHKLNILHVGM